MRYQGRQGQYPPYLIERESIDPNPFIPKREETSGEERYARGDDETHQKDLPNKVQTSGDQDRPHDSPPMIRSPRIREMAEKMRERDKSIKVFTSMKQ